VQDGVEGAAGEGAGQCCSRSMRITKIFGLSFDARLSGCDDAWCRQQESWQAWGQEIQGSANLAQNSKMRPVVLAPSSQVSIWATDSQGLKIQVYTPLHIMKYVIVYLLMEGKT
jgi:hypothetical protein